MCVERSLWYDWFAEEFRIILEEKNVKHHTQKRKQQTCVDDTGPEVQGKGEHFNVRMLDKSSQPDPTLSEVKDDVQQLKNNTAIVEDGI